ncbi:MAG TPA: type I DNA topoisomerase [Candidatus Brocadiia bacterium]|nr:type I DNA topoisomerase [Candidatus Brocadiia bacterium]
MSKLVIVESPGKVKTIKKYLGPGFSVEASMGHVRDLPDKKIGVDIEAGFEPTYEVMPGRKKAIAALKSAAKKAEQVFLATDLDREGEAIAWHLYEALGLKNKPTKRVVFNEITKPAIQAAFEEPRDLDMNKVNAQQARRILDRIVGYKLSPLLWKKLSRGLSAGRVQSVAVRLIVEREREIRAFKPEEFWRFTAKLAPKDAPKDAFDAELKKLDGADPAIPNEASARTLEAELRAPGLPYTVTKCVKRTRKTAAPPPFTTSTLQQQASIQLRFSAKKTMKIAQDLYEGIEIGSEGAVGLITYMRTDSQRVSEQAIAECRDWIGKNLGPAYLPEKPHYYRSGRSAQGAHEAIRPTDVNRTPAQIKDALSRDHFRLYQLIWNRFAASQINPAEWGVTDLEITAGRALFAAQGKKLLFDGFLRVAGVDAKDETPVPELAVGSVVDLLDLKPTQSFTKPPPRYSEASLVKELEKLGIGRPSTYAPIISTIQDRKYVVQEDRLFHATDLGEVVTDQLVKCFPDVMNVKFTSTMEEELDKVEENKAEWRDVLKEFYEPFNRDLEKAQKEMARPAPEQLEEKCPQCGKELLKRWSKRGQFIGCSGYPECSYTRNVEANGEAAEPLPEVNEACPQCGKPLTARRGRRGPFVGCTGYPECTFTRDLAAPGQPAAPALPQIKEDCPQCGKPLAVRNGRRGPFVGCTGYPKCRYARDLAAQAAPPAPPGAVCEKCGKPMTVKSGRRGFFLACTGYPDCKSTQPMPQDSSAAPPQEEDKP